MISAEKEIRDMKEKTRYQLSASGAYDLGKEAAGMGNEAPRDYEALRIYEALRDYEARIVQSLSDIERRYPEIWERYRPLMKLGGRVGQGLVVKAHDMESGESVAIKIFDLSGAGNWKSMELFEREVDVLRHLDIEGVPKYYDYVETKTYYYLVEEYINAMSLQEQMEEVVYITETETMTILRRCLEILSELHRMHPPIIHRNIKPSNILTRPCGDGSHDVCLIDFGSVTSASPKTQMSTVAGTIGYAAPEQLMGKSYPSSDLYALGMSMIHALTGKMPNVTSSLEVEYEDDLPYSTPERLKEWFRRVLVANPEERFQTADEALSFLNERDETLNGNNKRDVDNSSSALSNVSGGRIWTELSDQEKREIWKHDRLAQIGLCVLIISILLLFIGGGVILYSGHTALQYNRVQMDSQFICLISEWVELLAVACNFVDINTSPVVSDESVRLKGWIEGIVLCLIIPLLAYVSGVNDLLLGESHNKDSMMFVVVVVGLIPSVIVHVCSSNIRKIYDRKYYGKK